MTFKSFVAVPLMAASAAGVVFSVVAPAGAGQRIQVYEIPKESSAAPAPSAGSPHGAAQGATPSYPKLKWAKLPENWKENPNPGQMRAASFLVTVGEGNEADLAVVPMGARANVESQLVNMWRGQLRLPPLAEADMVGQSSEIPVGEAKGKLYEFVSTEAVIGDKFKARMLVTMLERPEANWFFKFAGEDTLIAGQRAAFLEFLKGVSFEAPTEGQLPPGHPPMAGGAPGGMPMGQGMMGGGMQGGDTVKAGEGEHPQWAVPTGWAEVDHSSFIVAKFRVTGEGGSKAEINVSTSSGMGGGLLPNVNRWRGQLSLGALDQGALDKLATALEVPAGKAVLVDFSGADSESDHKSRCVGVMVTLPNGTWFFKLAGTDSVVAREKDAFLKFVRSVKY